MFQFLSYTCVQCTLRTDVSVWIVTVNYRFSSPHPMHMSMVEGIKYDVIKHDTFSYLRYLVWDRKRHCSNTVLWFSQAVNKCWYVLEFTEHEQHQIEVNVTILVSLLLLLWQSSINYHCTTKKSGKKMSNENKNDTFTSFFN